MPQSGFEPPTYLLEVEDFKITKMHLYLVLFARMPSNLTIFKYLNRHSVRNPYHGKKNPENKINIRNSTSEFLIFTHQEGKKGIEARYEEGTIWLTQKLMAELFDVTTSAINQHLQNIFESQELDQNIVIRKFH